jgi:CubicO group peptidase (beta-lactamase class C family)
MLRRSVLLFLAAALCFAQSPYFPPQGDWQHRSPKEAGLNAEKLAQAVNFAQSNGSDWDFSKDQVLTFGRPLGPLPRERARTNIVIVKGGYIVAEAGDTLRADPMYSGAKSFLSTVTGLAADRGLIKVNDPVRLTVKDSGYDSPHNAKITWHHHLQQTSEWEGELWGKGSDFQGVDEFGRAARPKRAIEEPGAFYEYNDVRVNRLALSLLRVWKKPVPEVLRDEIMNPIGASDTWRWVPYENSWVEINGERMPSVSGGTRWGGGLWMNSRDMARFGLLFARKGKWQDKRLLSESWIQQATTDGPVGPDYGYLWWLNTQGKAWPDLPKTAFAAVGNGENVIWIDSEHDLVIVWRWFRGGNKSINELGKRVIAAMEDSRATN